MMLTIIFYGFAHRAFLYSFAFFSSFPAGCFNLFGFLLFYGLWNLLGDSDDLRSGSNHSIEPRNALPWDAGSMTITIGMYRKALQKANVDLLAGIAGSNDRQPPRTSLANPIYIFLCWWHTRVSFKTTR